jgi:hypothetical protein
MDFTLSVHEHEVKLSICLQRAVLSQVSYIANVAGINDNDRLKVTLAHEILDLVRPVLP